MTKPKKKKHAEYDLLERIQQSFAFMFDLGFVVTRDEKHGFGREIEITSRDQCFRFFHERGFGVEVGVPSREWFDVNLIRYHMKGGNLHQKYEFSGFARFLKSNFRQIKALFSKAKIAATIDKMHSLREARAQELYRGR